MKVIHITGNNYSNVTSFADKVLGRLSIIFPGKTGVIREGHSGDKTLHKILNPFEAESRSGSAIITIGETNLSGILDLFADSGVVCAVLTGFENCGLGRVVIGDTDPTDYILKDPSVEEVIESFDDFDDHMTMQGLIKEIKDEIDIPKTGCILSFNGIVREISGEERTDYMDFCDDYKIDTLVSEIAAGMEEVPGVLGVRFHHNKGRLYAGEDVTYIAVAASHRQEAFSAMMDAIDRLKSELHDT